MFINLDPDQASHFVRPDLGPNCLKRISSDNTSRQRVMRSFGLHFLESSKSYFHLPIGEQGYHSISFIIMGLREGLPKICAFDKN